MGDRFNRLDPADGSFMGLQIKKHANPTAPIK
jgi:hypothetical protein